MSLMPPPPDFLTRCSMALKASAIGIVGMAIEIKEGFGAIYAPFAHCDGPRCVASTLFGLDQLKLAGVVAWTLFLVVTVFSLLIGIQRFFGRRHRDAAQLPDGPLVPRAPSRTRRSAGPTKPRTSTRSSKNQGARSVDRSLNSCRTAGDEKASSPSSREQGF